jgi:hypothetical protein
MLFFNVWLPGRLWLATALLGLCIGCSGVKLQTVSGVVTLDGQPLSEGIVQFYGPGDRLSTARLQSDGTFVATDILPGDSIRVAVINDPDAAMMNKASGAKGKSTTPPVESGTSAAGKSRRLPSRYNNVNTSGLSYSISPESTHIVIQLNSH